MSYQVLARKWRPQNFKEMVGQEHVLRALMNALDSDRLHHAYLFTGTRGVGKTTIARILAKCLNCETGVTSTPCGECNSCQEIVSGNFLDLIEVDAASRTKVEDTRELLENVQYAPTRARFKVYLIDEVHMLTGHSFNALLKTLEEPPPHVKFLFATTDPQKLPATILSRCLQFNLKRMPIDMISGHLDYLLKQESIAFEEPALRLLSRAADGSMRDALSLLDQSIAYSGADITEQSVRDMLGTISHEPLIDLLNLIIAGEGAQLLKQVDDLSSVTPDFAVAADALITLLHQVAVQQVVPNAINEEQAISELAKNISKEEVQLFYQIALQGRKDLSLSPDPRSGFEMLLLRMLSFRPLREGLQLVQSDTDIHVLEERKKKTVISDEIKSESIDTKKKDNNSQSPHIVDESTAHSKVTTTKINSTLSTQANESIPPWEEIPPYLDEPRNVINNSSKDIKEVNNLIDHSSEKISEKLTTPDTSSIEDLLLQTDTIEDVDISEEDKLLDQEISEQESPDENDHSRNITFDPKQPWHAIVPQLNLSGRANELIKHCLYENKENGMISLVLNKDREDLYAESTKQEIQSAITRLYGTGMRFELNIANEKTDIQPKDKALETPAQRNVRKISESQQQAEDNIENDPFVEALKNRFGAQVVPGSVQPKSH